MLVATPFQVESSVISQGDGDVHVLAPEGELDIATVGRVQEELDAVLNGTEPRLLLDLSGLQFIDSTGIAALYHAGTGVAAMAVVVPPGAEVARTIEIAGVDRVLPLFGSREDALRELG
jgi:anti-sigma B factor antagonist